VREHLFREIAPQLMELPCEIGRKRLQMRLVYVSTKLEYSHHEDEIPLSLGVTKLRSGRGRRKNQRSRSRVIALLCRAGSCLEALLPEAASRSSAVAAIHHA